jgi:hypothetical protein
MKYWFPALLACLMGTQAVHAQKPVLDVGLRFQKTVNLYWENGFSVQYSPARVKHDQLYFGVSYISSRFGSAMNSNAIVQDNYLFTTSWYFSPRNKFRTLLRLNLGYFMADYEDPLFDVLENTSYLLSPEFGFLYRTNSPVSIMLTAGYNVFTGNGEEGAGTLYPVFVQTTLSWNLFRK